MFSHTHHIPVTLRDFFFKDPFFRTCYHDFDQLGRIMHEESMKFWNATEAQREKKKKMDKENKDANIAAESSSSNQTLAKEEDTSVIKSDAADFGPSFAPWFFPRQWPTMSGGEIELLKEKLQELNLFQHEGDNLVIRITDDQNKFELSLDTHGYTLGELRIHAVGRKLTVEGKHEERGKDKHELRNFMRSYTIPEECNVTNIKSNLSSDGILVITAPKKKTANDERDLKKQKAVKDA